jgi:phospholipid/cholesterol/gamma-HCH transport system substrate-binding protein
MMRRRDEVLVGLFTLTALAVLIVGTVLLARGRLSSGYPLYAKFEWGAGLKQGQPVLFSGVNVGYVDGVELLENGGLVTTLRIYKRQRVPTGTVATVEANGIFGDMEIALRANGPTGHMLQPGDTIRSAPGTAQIGDVIVRFDSLERSFIRLTNDFRAELIDKHTLASLRNAAGSATSMFKKIDSIAGVQSAEFSQTQESLRHAASAIDSAKIDSTLQSLRDASQNFRVFMDSLQATRVRLDGALDKLAHGTGSFARLVNDSTAYINARNAIAKFDSLLTDLKANPKKYLTVNVCVIRRC